MPASHSLQALVKVERGNADLNHVLGPRKAPRRAGRAQARIRRASGAKLTVYLVDTLASRAFDGNDATPVSTPYFSPRRILTNVDYHALDQVVESPGVGRSEACDAALVGIFIASSCKAASEGLSILFLCLVAIDSLTNDTQNISLFTPDHLAVHHTIRYAGPECRNWWQRSQARAATECSPTSPNQTKPGRPP